MSLRVHYSSQPGSQPGRRPLCGNRRAHMSTPDRDQVFCARCQSLLAKRDAKRAARNAKGDAGMDNNNPAEPVRVAELAKALERSTQ